MDQQSTTENKKSFLRDDRRLVCSMLVVYGVCILGLIAATLMGLDRRNRRLSAEATSTAGAIATEQARATATAVARATEQAQYAILDPFDDNDRGWLADSLDDEYMVGSIAINKGVYVWDVQKVKQTFVYWANFPRHDLIEDFDVYVDFKVAEGSPGDACGGIVFRTASDDLEKGAYVFSVCNNSYFTVYHYRGEEWEAIASWTPSDAIRNFDWNRVEISARGDHFTFLINNEQVYEMTDDRQPQGGLGVILWANEEKAMTVWFDNFGLQIP